MDTNTVAALNQFIRSSIADLEKGKDFAIEQIPDILNELILFKGIIHWLGVAFGIFLFALIPWMFKTFRNTDDDGVEVLCVFGMIGTTSFGLGFIFTNVVTAIQILVAPKLFLIEYAAKLVS